jgi:ABC-type polysaccharide/polyol phosphate transport system ATPase subunit
VTAAVSLCDVSKRYIKYDDTSVASRLWTRTKRSSLWALRDVDFEIQPGESVGVLGRNGAGKSTLLSMLCGVTAPTSGRIAVRGRVAPLISVGVGFHPEMTGRENVYVNGTILGMTTKEIDRRFDDIVQFAEIERFIDTPVKFYSSGMFVRLGFSVAVAAEPDVLLVDEVLAVGDLPFQIRCFERMSEIRAQGTTIVVVTHNLGSVRSFCDRGIVLREGQVAFDGPTFAAVSAYHELLGELPDDDPDAEEQDREAGLITNLEVLDADGQSMAHFHTGDTMTVRVSVEAYRDIDAPIVWLGVNTAMGIAAYSSANVRQPFPPLRAGEKAVYEIVTTLQLATGSYTAEVAFFRQTSPGASALIGRSAPQNFYLTGRGFVHGVADLNGVFRVSD